MPRPASALASWVTDHRPRRARDGYPEHVRAEVVRHVRPLLGAGRSLASLAREVGLPAPTLGRWLDAAEEPAGFTLVELRDVALERDPEARPLSLLTPGGYRVEGLDVDAVRALLAVLP